MNRKIFSSILTAAVVTERHKYYSIVLVLFLKNDNVLFLKSGNGSKEF